MLGIDAAVVNSDGQEVPQGEGGILVMRKPWPSMLRGIYGDRQRFLETYWEKVPGMYCPADGARVDDDGNFWITGRIDDVIVVAGHNLGTMEIESALVSHAAVAEAAVVGFPHDVKGTGIAAFVITQGPVPAPGSDEAAAMKKAHVRPCRQRTRADLQARPDPADRGAAQNPQRQDHASSAAGHRRGQRDHQRHIDPRRPRRSSRSCRPAGEVAAAETRLVITKRD